MLFYIVQLLKKNYEVQVLILFRQISLLNTQDQHELLNIVLIMQKNSLVFGALKNEGRIRVDKQEYRYNSFFGKNTCIAILCLFCISALLPFHVLHVLMPARNVNAVNIYKLLIYYMSIFIPLVTHSTDIKDTE